jgi:Spy/CpxP family protein refolding chaperone
MNMRRLAVGAAAVALVVGPLAAAPAVADPAPSCWGQATQVFAQMGLMGDHSSSYPTPRLGLRNLARAALGPDATMADLGVFVSNDLGLSIDACLG